MSELPDGMVLYVSGHAKRHDTMACLSHVLSVCPCTVDDMTTTETTEGKRVNPFASRTLLCRYVTPRGSLSVVHDAGRWVGAMRWHVTLIHCDDETQDIVIRCKTKESAVRLFADVQRYHAHGFTHPFVRPLAN